MTAKTSQKLADALRAAGFEALAKRAEADEFHDYLSPHATPELELVRLLGQEIEAARMAGDQRRLTAAGNVRMRVVDGDFDATKEEGDEWAASPEGQEAFAKLMEENRPPNGGTAGPIQSEYREQMKRLARIIDEHFNGDAKGHDRKVGFALLVFPFGEGTRDRINYLSNAERADMITAMKELIARFEGRHPEESGQGSELRQ